MARLRDILRGWGPADPKYTQALQVPTGRSESQSSYSPAFAMISLQTNKLTFLSLVLKNAIYDMSAHSLFKGP